jgi:hypothetical protein
MTEIMMALGQFRFSLDSAAYQGLTRTSAYRWSAQDRVGREPSHQFVGAGAETIELRGTVYPHFRGGLAQVDRMRAEAGAGEPLQLVDGRGRVWGQYVITRVMEEQARPDQIGIPRRMAFNLSLTRYGEDL